MDQLYRQRLPKVKDVTLLTASTVGVIQKVSFHASRAPPILQSMAAMTNVFSLHWAKTFEIVRDAKRIYDIF